MRIPAQIASALAMLMIACGPIPIATASTIEFNQRTISAADDPVDINTATLQQLIKVPGMTRTWAARIIRFRPYRGKNELIDRGIVTDEVYARIKSHIIAHRVQK